MPWDELCVTWAEVMQAARPYQSTVPACVHPSAQLLTLIGCCSPEEKSGWQMSACWGWSCPWTTHCICIPSLSSRRHTQFPSNLGSSSVLMLHPSSPAWLSCLTESAVPLSLLALVPHHGVHRGSQGCTLSLSAAMEKEAGEAVTHTPALPASGSTQSGIRDAWGAASTILPTLRGRKGLHPSYICVFAVCTFRGLSAAGSCES